MNILHLDASTLGENSVSRQLSADIVSRLRTQYPRASIQYRDLAAEPIPHWQPVVDASREPSELGTEILDQFLAADIVVIGTPMYNFGVPTQLKAWIDRIAVPGKVFRYTENGPQGLVGGKRVIVASSRGGIYSEGPAAHMDFQEKYLHAFFGFIGIEEVEVIRAEGIAIGPEQRKLALDKAHQAIRALMPEAA
jgi:FMN-dependent NADH-azoreductase